MGTEPLSWFGGGRRSHEEQIEARHTGDFTQLRAARMSKTLLLLCGLYCVLARERVVLQYTRAAGETERGKWVSSFFPLRAHGASFYMLKGLPTGGSAGGGKN